MSTPAVLAQPQGLLTHHVQPAVLNGQAPFVGKLPANQTMRIDIVMAVRDQASLDRFLQDVYDPSSSSYRQFLTVDQFTQKFGPSQHDYDALVRFASANGLTMTGGSRDAMDVQFKGSVAAFETAFHVNLGVYHDANANREFLFSGPRTHDRPAFPTLAHHRPGQLFHSTSPGIAPASGRKTSRYDRLLSKSILLR